MDGLLDREWKMANGMGMRILATFMDSGGHFTESVYKECAKRGPRRMWAIKGEGGEGKPYVRLMKMAISRTRPLALLLLSMPGKKRSCIPLALMNREAGICTFRWATIAGMIWSSSVA